MATYIEWNEALYKYIIAGLPQGARVYLEIDDEVINFLANQLKTQPEDFLFAIRLKCLRGHDVDLNRIFTNSTSFETYKAPPRYLAFLCAMVLAAHRMGESIEQGVDENNYFYYLNEILGLSNHIGRPKGMMHGEEEKLWKDWAIWLRLNGFQPTATMTGVHYYTYARSQALLRQSDKDSLWRHFSHNESGFPNEISNDELIQKLQHQAVHLTSHLRELFAAHGKIGAPRYDDLSDAIFEVFESWIDSGRQTERTKGSTGIYRRALHGGLYRVVDFLTQEPEYYILPKLPRHVQVSDMSVVFRNETESLSEERPGWFEPLPWMLSSEELNKGLIIHVIGSEQIHQLVLPNRDFWILPPDPEDIASGIFASRAARPELGVPFVLICKPFLDTDLNHLKREGLLDWNGAPKKIFDGAWLEYTGMTVLSDTWIGVSIQNKDLMAQLRPRSTASISFRGGLRDPHANAWLVGYGPEIIVQTFVPNIEILIRNATDGTIITTLETVPGEPTHYDWAESGIYQVEINTDIDTLERSVSIIDWSALKLAKTTRKQPIQFKNIKIFGAFIE